MVNLFSSGYKGNLKGKGLYNECCPDNWISISKRMNRNAFFTLHIKMCTHKNVHTHCTQKNLIIELEKKMAIHSSILAWEIPWTEKPGGLQSTGSQTPIDVEMIFMCWFAICVSSLVKFLFESFPHFFFNLHFYSICNDVHSHISFPTFLWITRWIIGRSKRLSICKMQTQVWLHARTSSNSASLPAEQADTLELHSHRVSGLLRYFSLVLFVFPFNWA